MGRHIRILVDGRGRKGSRGGEGGAEGRLLLPTVEVRNVEREVACPAQSSPADFAKCRPETRPAISTTVVQSLKE